MRPDSSEDSLTRKVCIQTAHGIYASEEPQGLALWKRTSTRTTRDPAGLEAPRTLIWALQQRPDDPQPPPPINTADSSNSLAVPRSKPASSVLRRMRFNCSFCSCRSPTSRSISPHGASRPSAPRAPARAPGVAVHAVRAPAPLPKAHVIRAACSGGPSAARRGRRTARRGRNPWATAQSSQTPMSATQLSRRPGLHGCTTGPNRTTPGIGQRCPQSLSRPVSRPQTRILSTRA